MYEKTYHISPYQFAKGECTFMGEKYQLLIMGWYGPCFYSRYPITVALILAREPDARSLPEKLPGDLNAAL